MSGITRRGALKLGGATVAVPALLNLGACSPTGGSTGGKTLKILQYEDPTTPQGIGWKHAVELFQKKHPDVTVDFQQTSFDAVRQSAKITLSGNDVPDVVEFNKGNADGGQLAAQGLLSKLTDVVAERGWDKKITGSMRSFAQYENGKAGSGDWYGVPNIGEYVTFFYNKDLFAKVGADQPPASIAELESLMDKLQAEGITPISSSAATSQGFNQMWIWYSLVSAYATRNEIDDFMFTRAPIDFNADPWKKGTHQFQEWIDKKYTGERISGLNFEQATVNWLSQSGAMVMWNHGVFTRAKNEAKFNWGWFTMPGANLTMGSSGHLLGVPEKAKNKDLAYDFIDLTLSEEVQNLIGTEGGLAIAGDTSLITDDVSREYAEGFTPLMEGDLLSFYPDYPVTGFLDFIQEHMQKMSNGNQTADEYLAALQKFYDAGLGR